ncbi:restriction endonuclease PLD domain-containing protein [Planococcus sp. FY231025]|uniref:restriction endonuclease PLD domain-containing protein n=1 Tax=Planococcus sp. FY231025 TaxID=3455699 RepID=UPI003F8DCFE5
MFLTNNLEEKIFSVHKYIECDELQILSGYVGPNPVKKLIDLPLSTVVIYGMYGSELVPEALHNALKKNHIEGAHEILYSDIPIHSKCYVWKLNGSIVYALVGSANFSNSGLCVSNRESLAEITSDSFKDLETYMTHIQGNCLKCTSPNVKLLTRNSASHPANSECSMLLYNPQTGEVPLGSGLNWGHSVNGHTNIGDSYITIRTSHLRNYPMLFPKKQINTNLIDGVPKGHRRSDPIELIWDDGQIMQALLEGTQPMDETRYPKQISSFPSKNILGIYIRKRMGLPPNALITMEDLEKYGRKDIKISLLKDGTYYIDFAV